MRLPAYESLLITLLVLQGIVGGADTLINHELLERLPARAEARGEIGLHALREAIYGMLFAATAWYAWHGAWAFAIAGLLAVEILVDPGAVARAYALLQFGDVRGERIEKASPVLEPRAPVGSITSLAEQAFEYHLRIDFVRQRLGRTGPGNGVGVRAAIAPSTDARARAGIFDRDLQRR